MTDNFDLRKYLVENKVTTNSRMLNEGNTPTEVAAEVLSWLDAHSIEDIQAVPDTVGESLLDYFGEDPTFNAPEGMFTKELKAKIAAAGKAYKQKQMTGEEAVSKFREMLTNPSNYTEKSKMMKEGNTEMEKIQDFVFSQPNYEGLSEEELEDTMTRYQQEWKSVSKKYPNIEAYFSDIERRGDFL